MRRNKLWAIVLGVTLVSSNAGLPVVAQQAVCATIATMPNSLWTGDNGGFPNPGETWSLNQDLNGNLSGTYTSPPSGPCAGLHYPVSGTYSSNGSFTINASSSSVPSACPISIHFTGAVSGVGCNTANVTWFSSFNGTSNQGQGGETFTHACYTPSTETTPTLVQWGYQGNDPTFATFTQSLVPSTYNWGGRTFYETSPVQGSDSCYFPNPDGVVPVTTVTGGGVTIASGSSYKDDIGASAGAVLYYRAHQRAPCGFQVRQALWAQCDAGHTTDVNYLTYTDSTGIGTTDVTAVRGPKSVTTFWIAPQQKAAAVRAATLILRRKN